MVGDDSHAIGQLGKRRIRQHGHHALARLQPFGNVQTRTERFAHRHLPSFRHIVAHHPDETLAVFVAHRRLRHRYPRRIFGGRRRRFRGLLALLQECHLHAHVWQDSRIALQETDAHAHRRLVAIRRRNGGDHLGGNVEIGIGVQRRRGGLLGIHAIDVRLVDIHLHFQRIHIDDGANAGAREAAASGNRRDHFARLRRLGDDDARERSADFHVFQLLPLHRQAAFRHHDVALGTAQPRLQPFQGQLVAIQFRLADQLPTGQIAGTLQVQFRLANVDANLLQGGPRGFKLRLRQTQASFGNAVVEHGQ